MHLRLQAKESWQRECTRACLMALWPWMEGARLAPSCCSADGSSASALMFFRSPGGSHSRTLSNMQPCVPQSRQWRGRNGGLQVAVVGMQYSAGVERTGGECAQRGVSCELAHVVGHQCRLEVARHGALHVQGDQLDSETALGQGSHAHQTPCILQAVCRGASSWFSRDILSVKTSRPAPAVALP